MSSARSRYRHIQVDGGINLDAIPLVTKAGANVLVGGMLYFNKVIIPVAVDDFRNAVRYK